jgi:hypothetical protein
MEVFRHQVSHLAKGVMHALRRTVNPDTVQIGPGSSAPVLGPAPPPPLEVSATFPPPAWGRGRSEEGLIMLRGSGATARSKRWWLGWGGAWAAPGGRPSEDGRKPRAIWNARDMSSRMAPAWVTRGELRGAGETESHGMVDD